MKKEDVLSLLVKGLGKQAAVDLGTRAAEDAKFFELLVDQIRSGKKTPAMKASWVLQHAASLNQQLATKHAEEFMTLLEKERVGGVQRELLKILGHCKWTADDEGKYIDICFKFLNSPTADVGAKYHCISNIKSVLKKHPELKGELLASLESQKELYTDAWKRYTSKLIAQLEKHG